MASYGDFGTGPDLLVNFAFAKVSYDLTPDDTTLYLDDASQLPTNDQVAAQPFFMTLSSDLTYPPTFEIVQVTAVEPGTPYVTVTRGMRNTVACTHKAGTYIKATVDAQMLRRLAYGYGGSGLPDATSGQYNFGDRFFNYADNLPYFLGQDATANPAWLPMGGGGSGGGGVTELNAVSIWAANIYQMVGYDTEANTDVENRFPGRKLTGGTTYSLVPKSDTSSAQAYGSKMALGTSGDSRKIVCATSMVVNCSVTVQLTGLNAGDYVGLEYSVGYSGALIYGNANAQGVCWLTRQAPLFVDITQPYGFRPPTEIRLHLDASTSTTIDFDAEYSYTQIG